MTTSIFKSKRINGNWYQISTSYPQQHIIHIAYDINGEYHEDTVSKGEFLANNILQQLDAYLHNEEV